MTGWRDRIRFLAIPWRLPALLAEAQAAFKVSYAELLGTLRAEAGRIIEGGAAATATRIEPRLEALAEAQESGLARLHAAGREDSQALGQRLELLNIGLLRVDSALDGLGGVEARLAAVELAVREGAARQEVLADDLRRLLAGLEQVLRDGVEAVAMSTAALLEGKLDQLRQELAAGPRAEPGFADAAASVRRQIDVLRQRPGAERTARVLELVASVAALRDWPGAGEQLARLEDLAFDLLALSRMPQPREASSRRAA